MGKVTFVLNDGLEQRFREAIFKSKGMKRGNIQSAIEEAIRNIRGDASEDLS